MYFSDNTVLSKATPISPILVYVRNFDTCRKANDLVLGILSENGFDLTLIYYFSSLGRWCTEFIVSKSYLDEFSSLIVRMSNRNKLPPMYQIYVDREYNPLLPLSYDYERIRPELGSTVQHLLESEARQVMELHLNTAYKLANNSVLKTHFVETVKKLGLKQTDFVSTFPKSPVKSKNYNSYGLDKTKSPSKTGKTRKLQGSPLQKNKVVAINAMKKNWDTLSSEHIDAIVPLPQQHRLVVYTDGAYKIPPLDKDASQSSTALTATAATTQASESGEPAELKMQTLSAGIGVYFAPYMLTNINMNMNIKEFSPISSKISGPMSSAQAELQAVAVALKAVIASLAQDQHFSYSEIWICSDSRYVIDGINLHYKTWKSLDGKNCRGKQIANYSVFALISDYCSVLTINGFSLFFHYLPSHSGIDGNEIANLLARAAILS